MIAFPNETQNHKLKLKPDQKGSPKYMYIKEAVDKYNQESSLKNSALFFRNEYQNQTP